MGSKSAQKQARSSVKKQKRNKSVRSEVKTDITRAEKLILSGELDAAKAAVVTAIASLDGAVGKGLIHGNNAARRKSRLMKKLNKALKPPLEEKEPEKAA